VGDPAVWVEIAGRMLCPVSSKARVHVFLLPKGATRARLVSRAGLPTDARPWPEAPSRRLCRAHRAALGDRGEDERDRDGHLRRWTNGGADVPLDGRMTTAHQPFDSIGWSTGIDTGGARRRRWHAVPGAWCRCGGGVALVFHRLGGAAPLRGRICYCPGD